MFACLCTCDSDYGEDLGTGATGKVGSAALPARHALRAMDVTNTEHPLRSRLSLSQRPENQPTRYKMPRAVRADDEDSADEVDMRDASSVHEMARGERQKPPPSVPPKQRALWRVLRSMPSGGVGPKDQEKKAADHENATDVRDMLNARKKTKQKNG